MKRIVGAGLVALAAAVGLWVYLHQGIVVEVRNVGAEPMLGVVVHVTGNSYPIGDLPPGSTKKIAVNPTGESHIELEYQGRPRLIVDCYFEPGYNGTITADITPVKVVSVDNATRVGTRY